MTVRTRSRLIVLLAVAVFAAWIPLYRSGAAAARTTLAERAQSELALSCSSVTSKDGVHYTQCTGEIPSFDGIGLDTDLSIPTGATRPRATLVMLHGWSGDKTTWEADSRDGKTTDTWHWNNVWFVSRGWVVVNYTARGFKESCGTKDSDSNCQNGYTHLSDRRFETRDSQTLLGRLVDAHIAASRRLATTGGSYGGGQSWLLATSLPWTSPGGHSLQIRAAVPKYPWTDLLSSLSYNGRATDRPDQRRSHTRPIGVPKASYVHALYVAGRAIGEGRYDEDPNHPGTNLDLQFAFVQGGEPYDGKPNEKEIIRSYRPRSPFYARAYFDAVRGHTVREVPVLSIQGWTDPLFPPVETLQMFRRLKRADPHYPVKMVFGDVGHGSAANPAGQWHPINALANRFLSGFVRGQTSKRPHHQAYAFATHCPARARPQSALSGGWNGLARGTARGVGAGSQQTASADHNPGDGAASDPLTRSGCISEDSSTRDPGGAYWSFRVPVHGLTLLGLPTVRAHYEMSGPDAAIGMKLWDVGPGGGKTLVTRGAYRLSTETGDPAAGRVRTKLFGNFYRFAPHHEVLLQVTQDDSPYLRQDNLPSMLTWSRVTLVLPTRQAGARTLRPA
jgi:predicted acyl esterase